MVGLRVILITLFVHLNITICVTTFFLYNKLFFGYLMHFVILDLDMHIQNYGCLKLQGSA